jgi:sugar O-acyltransferase (sialic acid O-acetyltransferase NeuD family)
MADLWILGGGGLGREVAQYALDLPGAPWRLAGFVEDYGPGVRRAPAERGAILLEDAPLRDGDHALIAVGDPTLRRRLAQRAAASGLRFATIVHPRAYVAAGATVEEGCVVAPFAFVGDGAHLGPHVILNAHASAGHDAQVGAFTVLSPYAVVNGHVVLGEAVLLGTHASVLPRVPVGDGARVAAGSVVTRAVPARALAVGNPAASRVLYDG